MEEEKNEANTTVQFTFRIPVSLKSQLEAIAKNEDRSLSRQIISVLRKFVEEQKKKEAE